jgi:hypothetical protein
MESNTKVRILLDPTNETVILKFDRDDGSSAEVSMSHEKVRDLTDRLLMILHDKE